MKLYCSKYIFYKNASQGHNPAFFVLTASIERPSSRVPERGVPRRGEESLVVIISLQGLLPTKVHMQWFAQKTHIQVKCLHECHMSCMNCHYPHIPESLTDSLTPTYAKCELLSFSDDNQRPFLTFNIFIYNHAPFKT